MSDTYVVDNDFLDKLAKADQLELLRLEGKKIIVTDKVVSELDKGVRKNVQSAIEAYEWLKKNRNEPWLELEAPTPSPELKRGHGERSIVDLINERKPIDPSVNYTILTDNKKDLNKITNLLHEPQSTPVFMVREFTNDLAHKNVLSVAEYNAIEQRMLDAKGFSEPRPQFASPPPVPTVSMASSVSNDDFDLTPDTLKQKHIESIAKVDTFKPQGVSEQAAKDYLDTPEGEKYFKQLREAAPNAPVDELRGRAIGQIKSGSELPRMEIINEPLVKIVPKGQVPTQHSPFWAKEAELDAAIAEGKNLSKHFGLPVGSETLEYDVYKITPKAPTEVFVGRLAPTVELDGLIHKSGGAMQYLTPNRHLYEDATFVKSVENRTIIPHQKELQIPSDLKNPVIQTVGGIPRTELATMSDALTQKHGYSQAQALEAVNARATLNTAIEDLKAGKTVNTSPEVRQSEAIVRQTNTVLGDTPQTETMRRQVSAYNSAANGADSAIVQAHLDNIDKPLTRNVSQTSFQKAYSQSAHEPAPTATTSLKVMDKHINAVQIAEHQQSTTFLKEQQIQTAEKSLTRTLTNTPVEPSITPSVSKTANHSISADPVGVRLAQGVGVAVVADQALDINRSAQETMRQQPTYEKQLVEGGAAYATGGAKAVVTNAAFLGTASVSVGATPVGQFVAGTAAAVGADHLYTGSTWDKNMQEVGRVGGKFVYDHTQEGRLKLDEAALKEQLKSNNMAIEQRHATEQKLTETQEALAIESKRNQDKVDATHVIDAGYAQFVKNNPKYDISRDKLDEHAEKLLNQGQAPQQAASMGMQNAVIEQQRKDQESLAKLNETDRQAALKVHHDNPSATVAQSINLVELQNNRGLTGAGGAPLGENLLKAAQANIERANFKADPYYHQDPRDRQIDTIKHDNQVKTNATYDYIESHSGVIGNIQQIQQSEQHMMSYWKTHNKEHDQKLAAQAQRYHGSYEQPPKYSGSPDKYGYVPVHVKPSPVHHPKHVPHQPAPRGMHQGAHGEQVKQVQHALNALGAGIATDGHFGHSTTEALKHFQKQHHLTPDGELDHKTAKVMVGALQQEHTKHVQEALNTLGADIKVNGHMDKATTHAIKEFQTEHHLKATGTLDDRTASTMSQAMQAQQEQKQSQVAQAAPSVAQTPASPQQADRSAPIAAANNPETTQSDPQLERMMAAMAATPAFASLSHEEKTAMAQGFMNLAQQTPAPSQTVEAIKPDHAAHEVARPHQPAQVATPTAQTFDAQSAPKPVQTDEPIQLPPRIATLQEQIKGHLTNHPEFGNQIAHLSDKDQQTAIALATYEATHNRAKAVDYVWISPKGEVCMSFDGDKGFSGAMNMNQVQNNDANQVLAASVNLQQTQQHNLAQRQEHSQRQAV